VISVALPKQSDVVIIGAGAAGLMCAMAAGARGRKVLVLDHANKAGKKILMSGGGRCNFTNLEVLPRHFLSANEHFCKSALARFTQWDFIGLVLKHAIPYHEKKLGQLFCDNKAQDILTMLLAECAQAGAEIVVNCAVIKVIALSEEHLPYRYKVQSNLGEILCESLVIATGGLSIPTMGATGFGYGIAEQFKIPVRRQAAGLVPFTLSPAQLSQLSGCIGNAVEVSVSCGTHTFLENVLFTHRGLSGPAILQISSYWQPGELIVINLLPQINLVDYLRQQQLERPKAMLATLMGELLTKSIAQCFCENFVDNGKESRPINQYTAKEIVMIAAVFHEWSILPAGTEGYRTAEVTLGGVDTDYLSSKTMEVKHQPGLFFIGEVVDVTGHLGGFNFQWAWASGYAAAQFV
jgi:predicted Rossmann fold flavoprotein